MTAVGECGVGGSGVEGGGGGEGGGRRVGRETLLVGDKRPHDPLAPCARMKYWSVSRKGIQELGVRDWVCGGMGVGGYGMRRLGVWGLGVRGYG
jgi:hypothetical protein